MIVSRVIYHISLFLYLLSIALVNEFVKVMRHHIMKTYMIILIVIFVTQSVKSNEKWENWKDLSQDEYIYNRFKCQIIIDDFNWENTKWPKDNPENKPSRQSIISNDKIYLKVLNNIQMESALKDLIGISINDNLIQNDIDRMQRNTRNWNKLSQLFLLLNNDSRSIGECISRPNLVIDKLTRNYEYNDLFHNEVKHAANEELAQYHLNKNENSLSVNSTTYIYKKIEETNRGVENTIKISTDTYEVTIDSKEFNELSSHYSINIPKHNDNVQEFSNYFLYEEVIQNSDDVIEIKSWKWKKQSFEQWWSKHKIKWKGHTLSRLQTFELSISNNSKHSPVIPGDSWYVPDIPTARVSHTAVWTGAEMIIWGGDDTFPSNIARTGGRYNPLTDSWRKTTLQNSPTSRFRHTAIWTGTEMIVWGGNDTGDSSGAVNTGGRYNPITDSWSDLNIDNAPASREHHTAVWTGQEMIVWGGFAPDNEGGVYNPKLDEWRRTNIIGAPDNQVNHSAIWTGQEMIVWGGGRNNEYSNQGGRYNPISNTWFPTSIENAPSERYSHSSVWTGDKMIIWGGEKNDASIYSGSLYDPVLDSWTDMNVTNAPIDRSGHTAVWTGDKMIIWGGSRNGTYYDIGNIYDPISDDWELISNSNDPTPRIEHTAIWTGDSMIIWGGERIIREATGGIYNPIQDSWIQTKSSGEPSSRKNASIMSNEANVFVWGGSNGYAGGSKNDGKYYDPILDQWYSISTINAPDSSISPEAIWTGTDMIIWGGGGFAAHIYNPLNDQWMSMNTINSPSITNRAKSAEWTGTEMIVWGGSRFGQYPREGGRYNPKTDNWAVISELNAPNGRDGHTTIWTGEKYIVWGGRIESGDETNTGGIYDPITDTWEETGLGNAALERRNHSAVWTGGEMIIWGGSGEQSQGSGIIYNSESNSWSFTTMWGVSPGSPERGSHHSAAWTGSEMIIWGKDDDYPSEGGIYNLANDEWRYLSSINAPRNLGPSIITWSRDSLYTWKGDERGSNFDIYFPYDFTPDRIFINGFEG